MPRSCTLVNDKNNVIRRNRRHLIKMDPKFLKIENENMDNGNRTTNKTWRICKWTWRSDRTSRERDWTSRSIELHNSNRKKSNQVISIWWTANSETFNCKNRMLCVSISFHHPVSVCVLHLSCLYVIASSTKVHPIHFIYRSPSHSFHLPISLSFI